MREKSLIVSRQGIRITLQKQTAEVHVSRVGRVMQRSHFSEANKRIKRANILLDHSIKGVVGEIARGSWL